MDQVIIYLNEVGGVSVIIPSPNCGLSLKEIAAKDTPSGRPYRIVDVDSVPSDRTFRDAWEANFSVPDGYGA